MDMCKDCVYDAVKQEILEIGDCVVEVDACMNCNAHSEKDR